MDSNLNLADPKAQPHASRTIYRMAPKIGTKGDIFYDFAFFVEEVKYLHDKFKYTVTNRFPSFLPPPIAALPLATVVKVSCVFFQIYFELL